MLLSCLERQNLPPKNGKMGVLGKLYVHEITIPSSIYPVQAGLNNIMYFRLTNFTSTRDVKVSIPSSSYVGATLATALHILTDGFLANNDCFTITYDYDANNIYINLNYVEFSFRVLTDYAMYYNVILWEGDTYDKENLMSLNQVLGNYTPALNSYSWTSGYITLLALRNVYLVCSELSDARQLGSTGAYAIIKQVPINAPFGSVIYDNEIIGADYINVSNRVLRTLHFKLVNSYGNVVDLNNVDVSFSLTFVEEYEIDI